MPLAHADELRLDRPAGTITLSIQGRPTIVLRRPLVGEICTFLERWEELRGEVYDLGVEVVEQGRRVHPRHEGVSFIATQQIGPRWLSEVIKVLTDGAEVIDSRDLPAWTTAGGTTVFNALTGHWFDVPLAFTGSTSGSGPTAEETTPTAPTPTEPLILRQAILGGPAPG